MTSIKKTSTNQELSLAELAMMAACENAARERVTLFPRDSVMRLIELADYPKGFVFAPPSWADHIAVEPDDMLTLIGIIRTKTSRQRFTVIQGSRRG